MWQHAKLQIWLEAPKIWYCTQTSGNSCQTNLISKESEQETVYYKIAHQATWLEVHNTTKIVLGATGLVTMNFICYSDSYNCLAITSAMLTKPFAGFRVVTIAAYYTLWAFYSKVSYHSTLVPTVCASLMHFTLLYRSILHQELLNLKKFVIYQTYSLMVPCLW